MDPTPATFSRSVFLRDLKSTALALDAAYSVSVANRVIEAFPQNFHEGPVMWRATSRPGAAINYRVYQRRPMDTVVMAVSVGLLRAQNTMTRLASAMSARYPQATGIADFDSKRGLSKSWFSLASERPLAELLWVPGIPEPVRRNGRQLREMGLYSVRHIAINYLEKTMNYHFPVAGHLDERRCRELVALADAEPPSRTVLADMSRFIPADWFTFSVTMTEHGEIKRVGFYALKPVGDQWPALSGRLVKFFQTAPSRDTEEVNTLAWSFGAGGLNYMKAERSYSGSVHELMSLWNRPPILASCTGRETG
jgi:4-hydroxyphenylpyruvate 3-dimethylallyltransferase